MKKTGTRFSEKRRGLPPKARRLLWTMPGFSWFAAQPGMFAGKRTEALVTNRVFVVY